MSIKPYNIFPLGVDGITIEFEQIISVELNQQIVNLSEYITKKPFEGFIETVPAYNSLTVFFDLAVVKKKFDNFPTAFAAVKHLVENALLKSNKLKQKVSQIIEITVDFDKQNALDLEYIADRTLLSPDEIIKLFVAKTYRVFMLGFLPGFAYMGEIDERISVPRKDTPRLKVPKGSVGIAGRQTGIYPFDSPGGWQIIGKTDFELFTPDSKTPTSLQPGNFVKFVSNK